MYEKILLLGKFEPKIICSDWNILQKTKVIKRKTSPTSGFDGVVAVFVKLDAFLRAPRAFHTIVFGKQRADRTIRRGQRSCLISAE